MTLDNDRNPIAPHHPSDPPPRRPAAEGAQTGAEGVAAPAASPVATSPVKSTHAGGEGSPAAAQPSTPRPASHGDRRALVGAILGAIPRHERGAFAGAVYAAAAAPDVRQRADARVNLNLGAYAFHAAAVLHAYGVDVVAIDAPPRADDAERDSLAFDLDAAVAVLDASSTPPRVLRLTVAPPVDLDALLAAVGEQCERNCNGDLAISLAAARRIVDGRSPHAADGTVADALAWLLVDLRRDIRDAARGYREAVHELACARRNDDDATVARCAERLRSARAEVARVGALAGRIAAAVTAAEE